jgi:hypothetical protein
MTFSVATIRELVARERRQLFAFVGLSLVAAGMTAAAHASNEQVFRRFIGKTHPLVAVACASLLGLLILSGLLLRGSFAILGPGTAKGPLRAAGLAVPFGLVVILADLEIVFPADMNVPFPDSLLVYRSPSSSKSSSTSCRCRSSSLP